VKNGKDVRPDRGQLLRLQSSALTYDIGGSGWIGGLAVVGTSEKKVLPDV